MSQALSSRRMMALSVGTALIACGAMYYIAPGVTLLGPDRQLEPVLRRYHLELRQPLKPRTVARRPHLPELVPVPAPAPRVVDEVKALPVSRPTTMEELLVRKDEILELDVVRGESAPSPPSNLPGRVEGSTTARPYDLQPPEDVLLRMDALVAVLSLKGARDAIEVPRRLVRTEEQRLMAKDAAPELRTMLLSDPGAVRLPMADVPAAPSPSPVLGPVAAADAMPPHEPIAPLATISFEEQVMQQSRQTQKRPLADVENPEIGVAMHILGEEGFYRITLGPGDATLPRMPKNVLVLVETSKYVSQREYSATTQGVADFLKALNKEDRFSIAAFGEENQWFQPVAVTPNGQMMDDALAFLRSRKTRGDANLSGALQAGLSRELALAQPNVVVLITAGRPTAGEAEPGALLGSVARQNAGRYAIFVVAIGKEPNTSLLENLAASNEGMVQQAATPDTIQRELARFAKLLDSPLLTDITLSVTSETSAAAQTRALPDWYSGRPPVFYGTFVPAESRPILMRIAGMGAEGNKEYFLEVDVAKGKPGGVEIARGYARERTRVIQSEMARAGETPALAAELQRLVSASQAPASE